MKERCKRVLAMLLCMVMVLSMAACGGGEGKEPAVVSEGEEAGSGEQEQEPGNEASGEITTLTIYTQFGSNGLDGYPWFEKFLGEELGIYLESRTQATDASLLDPMLAGNDLTDIIGMESKSSVTNAVTGGMLVDLEQYKEQLPHIFENEEYQMAIESMRDSFGGVYVMPLQMGKKNGLAAFNPQLRWNLYEQMGMPEMKDLYDLLDVLKQMLELQPETEDGLPVYGMGSFNSWDGNNRVMAVDHGYMSMLGYDEEQISSLAYIKYDGSGEVKYLLDDDSAYKEGLQWLFTANQMGVLDPESATMDWETYVAKANGGQYLYTTFDWFGYGDENADDWWGHASVWPENVELPVMGEAPFGDSARLMGISSKCEHIDKALAFLDWYFSEEGMKYLYNGPEGILWEYDESGKKVLTDEYIECTEKGGLLEHPDGGNMDVVSAFGVAGAKEQTVYDETGQCYNLRLDSYANSKRAVSKMKEDFIEKNGGYRSRFARAEAEGKNLIPMSPIMEMINPAPDAIEEIRAQIGEIVVKNSWKMIYASDQAEFDALWAQIQEDAEALGGQQVYEDAVARWNEAVSNYEKYKN